MRTRSLLSSVVAAAAVLASCQPSWTVKGVVYDGAKSAVASGGQTAWVRALPFADVVMKCPGETFSGKGNNRGEFNLSKGGPTSIDSSCEIEIAYPGYVTFKEKLGPLCDQLGVSGCSYASFAVQLTPISAPSPVPSPAPSTPSTNATPTNTAPTNPSTTATAPATATAHPTPTTKPNPAGHRRLLRKISYATRV